MRKRVKNGAAAFYRAYRAGEYATLQEAIQATHEKAAVHGWTNFRVNPQQTGLMPNGGYFVALSGRN